MAYLYFFCQPKIAERDGILRENRQSSAKARVRDLDVSATVGFKFKQPKYLLCDPLPDPSNERDLTTFITIWSEGKDGTLPECTKNC